MLAIVEQNWFFFFFFFFVFFCYIYIYFHHAETMVSPKPIGKLKAHLKKKSMLPVTLVDIVVSWLFRGQKWNKIDSTRTYVVQYVEVILRKNLFLVFRIFWEPCN